MRSFGRLPVGVNLPTRREIFRDYRATVGWPGAAFYRQLIERYPDAKVILTLRDPDRWYESALNTIYGMRKFASSPIFSLVGVVVPDMRHRRRAAQMVNELAWEGVFGGKFEDRQYAIGVFSRLNEEVKEGVPAERLLVYEVKEGWEPLGEFLGVEVPKGRSFPTSTIPTRFLRGPGGVGHSLWPRRSAGSRWRSSGCSTSSRQPHAEPPQKPDANLRPSRGDHPSRISYPVSLAYLPGCGNQNR